MGFFFVEFQQSARFFARCVHLVYLWCTFILQHIIGKKDVTGW